MDYCKRIKRDLLQGERDYYNRKYTLTIRSIASQRSGRKRAGRNEQVCKELDVGKWDEMVIHSCSRNVYL